MIQEIQSNRTGSTLPGEKTDWQLQTGIAAFLVLAILLTYWQVFGYEFISYDTLGYVTLNIKVHKGVSLDNIAWAYKTNFFSNWHPLTWLSYMVDTTLWGVKPAGFHATNVFLHSCNTLLLFFLLRKMTGKTWESGLVAGLFALHPQHTESVAWIAERKDVLSTFFFFLTLAAYLAYLQRPRLPRYLLALFLFTLGLMSKVMIVTLPILLLLLDYWPLHRYGNACRTNSGKTPGIQVPGDSMLSIISEKIPFLLLAAWCSWMNVYAQVMAITPVQSFSVPNRLLWVLSTYPAYLAKTFWPTKLAVFYPYPTIPSSLFAANIYALLLLGIFSLAWMWRNKHPWFSIGWLWFIGALFPVSGLFQTGAQFIADRYTYIPHIGVFILLSWGLQHILVAITGKTRIFPLIAGALCLTIGLQTWQHLHYWKDDYTLWRRAIEVTGSDAINENNLAAALLNISLNDDALKHALRAIELNPQSASGAYYVAGAVYYTKKDVKKGFEYFNKSLSINPNQPNLHYQLGRLYRANKMEEESISSYTRCILLNKKHKTAYYELGDFFISLSRTKDALAVYTQLAKVFPDDPVAKEKIQTLKGNGNDK